MRVRIGFWELTIRRVPPKASVGALGDQQRSLGKKKLATRGRSAL